MPLYAGMPWNDLEVLDGMLTVPMWWGGRAARVRVGKLPDSDVPALLPRVQPLLRSPLSLRAARPRATPTTSSGSRSCRAASLELCKALGFFPDVIHCNDWQTALVPVYLNTVEWMQPLHAAATIYSIHNLAYQGVFDGGAHVHHRARARALQPCASSSTSAR